MNKRIFISHLHQAIVNFNGSSGSYGVGFLTRYQPLQVRRIRIIHSANEEDRAALEIRGSLGGEIVRVIVTHLAHEGANYRTEQIKKIISWIDSGGGILFPQLYWVISMLNLQKLV